MVNGELFAEREWIFQDHFLQENIAIRGAPGAYHIQVSLVAPDQAQLVVSNFRIAQGSAQIDSQGIVEIAHENP